LYDARVAADPNNAAAYLNRARFAVQVFERQAALGDFNRAIALDPTAYAYLERSDVYDDLGQREKAIADAEEALRTDPASNDALLTLAFLKSEAGRTAEAIAMVQEKIDAGGDDDGNLLAARAEYEAWGGSTDVALASIDSAIEKYPGRASLLNSRCWLKGTMNVALDTALKDCTKSIELSDNPAQALDSRAMVYFRLGRMQEALEDLDAALEHGDTAASLYLRGVIRKRTGAADAAAGDLAAARGLEPGIVDRYRKWGVLP
jgi:tetratricopeptide (TPR) repeat protein